MPYLYQVIDLRLVHSLPLGNDRGDPCLMLVEERFCASEVVVAKRNGELADGLRDACTHRGRPDEPIVDREERMVGAAGDEIATGISSGEPHGTGGGVRAVLAEFDHLRAIDQAKELLGTGNL